MQVSVVVGSAENFGQCGDDVPLELPRPNTSQLEEEDDTDSVPDLGWEIPPVAIHSEPAGAREDGLGEEYTVSQFREFTSQPEIRLWMDFDAPPYRIDECDRVEVTWVSDAFGRRTVGGVFLVVKIHDEGGNSRRRRFLSGHVTIRDPLRPGLPLMREMLSDEVPPMIIRTSSGGNSGGT